MVGFRQKELALSEYGYRHKGRPEGCAFCSQNFHVFHRPLTCLRCSRNICKGCQIEKTCKLCLDLETLGYRKREWAVLCPFDPSRFGYGKMVANDLEHPHFVDWTTKAKLELHLAHILSDDLDNAMTCFIVTGEF